MGLEDDKIELPSMDLRQKPVDKLSSKERLNVSILNATMEALQLHVADIKSKKNRIQYTTITWRTFATDCAGAAASVV